MNNELSHPYLIVGGTGRVGRRLVQQLNDRGLPVRVTSRSGTVPFDWHDDTTWDHQLQGVQRAFVAFHPDIAAEGSADLLGRFAERADACGVRRVVLLSGRGEAAAREVEARVASRVRECTVLRSAFFMQDFSEHFLLDAVRAGFIVMPAGDTAEPFIDIDDLAAVAAQALIRDDLIGQTLELTGPELLTFAEAAGILSTVTGSSIGYQPCSVADFAAGAEADGMPALEARTLAEVFGQVLDGRNAHLTDDLGGVLGQPPRRFADFARAAMATGVWAPSDSTEVGAS